MRASLIATTLVATLAACNGPSKAPPSSQPGSATPTTPTPTTPAPSAEAPATSTPPATPGATPEPPPADLARMSNRFALALWSKLGPSAGNVALSPVSIATSLVIAWGGAKGETATQLQQALGLDGAPDALLSRWGLMTRSLQAPGRELTLRVANRLYGERSLSIDTIYFTLVRKAFDIWIEPVDFIGDAAGVRTKINAWVAEQTEQKIPALLPPGTPSSASRLVIVNALYFLADWAQPFDGRATAPREFYANGTTKKQVPTMQQTARFRYARDVGAALLELPYKGADRGLRPPAPGDAAMYLVLPDKRDGLAAVEATLESTLQRLQQAMTERQVQVSLPRFTIDPPAPLQLVDALQRLGIRDAFDGQTADFTNIAKPQDGQRLFISSVLHKAFVRVDEKGTEAAAATATDMIAGGPPPTPVPFVADHPFLFVIVDRPTGLILFLGRVVDPS